MPNVTEPLLQDSREILERLPAFESALETMDVSTIRTLVRFLTRSLNAHRHDEDDMLLPVLLKHLEHQPSPPPRPSTTARPPQDPHWIEFQVQVRSQAERLHDEHGWLAGTAQTLEAAVEPDSATLTSGEIRAEGRRLARELRRHLAAEINIIFPVAEQLLTEVEKRTLETEFGAHKRRGA